ncbi:MAG: 5'-deoxynucleotidase [Bacteroidetes bacterium]|nr:MAG: 5'-deoxynucleotidase [Bacteroidota bacterium]
MSHFFAYLSRMKYIERWGLMHNVHTENIQEHSLQVAQIAHALALIKNRHFGGTINPERVAILAMYHDASEVITGDLPTPIKYFSPKIKAAYKEIEQVANQRLLDLLPEEFQEDYESVFFPQEADRACWELVKAADKISAYLKCLEERKAGNQEFARAEQMLRQTIKDTELPEVQWFMQRFIPSMKLTLDELE